MSECTKGKFEAIYNTIYRKQTYIGGCVGYFEKTVLGDDVNEANAKEIVRRWNAFEDGGIVELCRDLKARLSVYEARHRDQCMLGDKCPDKRLLKKAEAALAKS